MIYFLRVSPTRIINLGRLTSMEEVEGPDGGRVWCVHVGDETIPLTASESAAFLEFLARHHPIRDAHEPPVEFSGGFVAGGEAATKPSVRG